MPMVALQLLHKSTSLLSLPESESNQLQLRIGLHSGTVVSGVMETVRAKYESYSNTINMTSRIYTNGLAGDRT